jgi:hypothetical protein
MAWRFDSSRPHPSQRAISTPYGPLFVAIIIRPSHYYLHHKFAPTNSMEIAFPSTTTAAVLTLIRSANVGQVASGIFTANTYGASGLLVSASVSVSGIDTFFVTSTAPITRIDITDSTRSASVFADNLTFANPVPEPGTLAALSAAFFAMNLRRPRAAK